MENNFAITEFENKTEQIARPIGAEIMASREAQEVQVAMVAAKRFPRDPITAYNRIISDCSRKSLAEKAMYEYTRSGTPITGPSIHLAKAIARGWGNLDSGFKVLESTPTESTVMAYCWDLETNYRETKVFTVKHVRETRNGSYPLKDSRDIYELVANQSARRERACILSVVPSDVVDAAVGQCEATLAGGDGKPLVDRVRSMVKLFQEQYGVTKEMLEKYVGRNADAFSEQTLIRFRSIYNAIKDGSASVEQYFPESNVTQENKEPDKKTEKPAKSDKQMGLDDL